MRNHIFIVFIALVPHVARAEWTLVTDELAYREYADFEAVERFPKVARIWTLIDYKSPLKGDKANYMSTKQLFEFDCVERKMRTLVFRNYSLAKGGGSVVLSVDKPDPWEYIEPDGGLMKFREAACTTSGDKRK